MRFGIFVILLIGILNYANAQAIVMADGSVVACSGATFFDSGGDNGNYDNGETYTLTICTGGSGAIEGKSKE